jgi:hypothetical protein
MRGTLPYLRGDNGRSESEMSHERESISSQTISRIAVSGSFVGTEGQGKGSDEGCSGADKQ